ncbi:MAG: septum formation family protein [Ilumatobacteraceae bacterium]
MLLSAVLVVTGVACSDDDDSPVVDLQPESVGVCLDFPDDTGPEVTDLPEVECEVEHTHEIIAIAQTTEQSVYPGFEALETDAQAQCLAAFEPYVGINPFDSDLFVSWLVPTLTTWDRDDDRQIVCVVGNGNGAPLVGTVRDSAR